MRKLSQLIFMIMVFLTTGCVKETYDMNKLSKKMHLSPTMAISAIKGNISLSDIVKSSDTVVFDDQSKFVTIIFKKDSVVDLKLTDFSKGILPQLTATIEPDTLNFDIEDILSHITGDFLISSPSIKFNYSNSFTDSIEINLNVTGKRKEKTIDLDVVPFILTIPNTPSQQEISDSYTIDKTNSSLPELISMLPEEIYFSGAAIMNPSGKNGQKGNYVLGSNHLLGLLEIEVPLEFRMNNLQFTDTVENFLKDDGSSNDSPVKPENFELLRVDITAKNGFPMGVSLKMSLYDSSTHTIKSTVNADKILEPAPVDSNGKATGTTETSTSIEFTKEFFSSVNKADKIIFQFTLNTTDNGSKDVKIYSDYRIDFTAALVLKPDIKFNLK
jgi:hypothetical protein